MLFVLSADTHSCSCFVPPAFSALGGSGVLGTFRGSLFLRGAVRRITISSELGQVASSQSRTCWSEVCLTRKGRCALGGMSIQYTVGSTYTHSRADNVARSNVSYGFRQRTCIIRGCSYSLSCVCLSDFLVGESLLSAP